MKKEDRILITGANGFVGKHLVHKLKLKGYQNIITFSSEEYDLTKEMNVDKLFKEKGTFEVVIHLAAVFGGIWFNMKNSGTIYYKNVMMNTLLMEKARQYNVDKFVGINTVYCYPENAEMPLKEEDLWKGRPDKNLASYGLSKRMMIFQSEVYREQYGFNSINLLFSNIYGPHANFDLNSAGVIPATIRKCIEAKNNNNDHITPWGTGKPTRDNLYVEDAADAILLATERYNKNDPVNIGGGIEVSIRELVNLIAELTGFTGKMIFDTSKPDGQLRQCLDTSKAKKEFGFEAKTDLREGLKRTIEWYMENH